MPEIRIVYQDCPVCGSRKEWGDRTIEYATKSGMSVRKVSFVTREGQELIAKAIEMGITRLPFLTDGKTFSYEIESFVNNTTVEVKKIKKTKVKAKAIEDGENGADK